MSRSTSGTRRTFWRADWLLALVVIAVVLIVYRATDAIDTFERRFYDFGSTSASRDLSDRIAVIAIDDQSIANIGRCPWPRDVHAQLIDKLAAATAKTIVYSTFFFEPQTDRGLVFIHKIKEALGRDAAAAANPQAAQRIDQAERSLDMMYKIANEGAPDVRVLRPELPGRLANSVALALCKRPEERYQTGEEFAADLRLVLPELPAADAALGQAQFGRTMVAEAAQVAQAAGYDPGRPAAEGESQRFTRTGPIEIPHAAGGGHGPGEGIAQTGKI